MSLNVFTEAA